MKRGLIGLIISLGWLASVAAQGIDPNTEFCLTSPGYFWVLHLDVSPQGHTAFKGHVHDLSLPAAHPCWTQYLVGSGNLYQPGHPKAGLADFVLQVTDVLCPSFTARVQGRLEGDPLTYTGWVTVDGLIQRIQLTLMDDCTTHP